MKKITIKNAQTLKDVVLELHSGVNMITGVTDVGKSTVVRCLRTLAFNRPSPDTLIRWGEKEVFIELEKDDGQTVARVRGKNNSYIVNGEVLNAVGTDVPDKVQEVLNLGEINIQKQIDLPFMMFNSSGEVGRLFNKLLGLDEIDISLKNIQSWLRKDSDYLEIVEKELQQTEEKLKKYVHLDKIEAMLDKIADCESKVKNIDITVDALFESKKRLTEINEEMKGYRFIPSLETAQSNVLEFEKYAQGYLNLSTQFNTLREHDRRLSEIKKREFNLDSISAKMDEYNTLDNGMKELSKEYNKEQSLKVIIEQKELEYESINKEYNELSKLVCPTCGRVIANDDCKK